MSTDNQPNVLSDEGFKWKVLQDLTVLDSAIKRISAHLESEIGTAERAMGRLEKSVEEAITQMKELHTSVFVGNGHPSISTRLDRIEQAQQRRNKHVWALYVAVIGCVLAVVGEAVSDHFKPAPPPVVIQAPAVPTKHRP